jgi:hypothetical protein
VLFDFDFVNLPPVQGTIASDCITAKDGRPGALYSQLFGAVPVTIPVRDHAKELLLGGVVLEQIAAYQGDVPAAMRRGAVILGNASPRTPATHETNGPTFGYFWASDTTLVVMNWQGECLSMLRQFGLAEAIRALDLREVLGLGRDNYWPDIDVEAIATDPYRSLKALPLMAWLVWYESMLDINVPHTLLKPDVPPAGARVLALDEHGNLKTTIAVDLADGFAEDGTPLLLQANGPGGEVRLAFYRQLQDIPRGKLGMYLDSVRYAGRALLGIAVGGLDDVNARQLTGLRQGDEVRLTSA